MQPPRQVSEITPEQFAEWMGSPVAAAVFAYYDDFVAAVAKGITNTILQGEAVSEKRQNGLYYYNAILRDHVKNLDYGTIVKFYLGESNGKD